VICDRKIWQENPRFVKMGQMYRELEMKEERFIVARDIKALCGSERVSGC
jgi:hypothetical protein